MSRKNTTFGVDLAQGEDFSSVGSDTIPQSRTSEKESTPPVEKTKKYLRGIVANCQFLNIREKPSLSGDILGTIPNGSSVKIDESDSDSEFYKVSTKDNINGFCVRAFIKLV